MKLFIPLFAAVLMVTISCTWIARKQSTEVLTILMDITDDYIPKPNIERLFERYYSDINASYHVRVATISHTKIAQEYEFKLPSANPLLVNEFTRKDQMDSFKVSIQQQIDIVAKTEQGKSKSYIAQKLMEEMVKITEQKGTATRIFVYSNLFENAEFNSYLATSKQLLENDQEKVVQILRGKETYLTDDHTEIYLIYQPQTYQEGIVFDHWTAIYRKLFPNNKMTVLANL